MAGCMLGIVLWSPGMTHGTDKGPKRRLPEGMYIELTRDFYETLLSKGAADSTVYTNDLSKEYLRQIAISSRFLVETNLEILKQQKKMIQLLQSGHIAKEK